jgi:hypothetical protein
MALEQAERKHREGEVRSLARAVRVRWDVPTDPSLSPDALACRSPARPRLSRPAASRLLPPVRPAPPPASSLPSSPLPPAPTKAPYLRLKALSLMPFAPTLPPL